MEQSRASGLGAPESRSSHPSTAEIASSLPASSRPPKRGREAARRGGIVRPTGDQHSISLAGPAARAPSPRNDLSSTVDTLSFPSTHRSPTDRSRGGASRRGGSDRSFHGDTSFTGRAGRNDGAPSPLQHATALAHGDSRVPRDGTPILRALRSTRPTTPVLTPREGAPGQACTPFFIRLMLTRLNAHGAPLPNGIAEAAASALCQFVNGDPTEPDGPPLISTVRASLTGPSRYPIVSVTLRVPVERLNCLSILLGPKLYHRLTVSDPRCPAFALSTSEKEGFSRITLRHDPKTASVVTVSALPRPLVVSGARSWAETADRSIRCERDRLVPSLLARLLSGLRCAVSTQPDSPAVRSTILFPTQLDYARFVLRYYAWFLRHLDTEAERFTSLSQLALNTTRLISDPRSVAVPTAFRGLWPRVSHQGIAYAAINPEDTVLNVLCSLVRHCQAFDIRDPIREFGFLHFSVLFARGHAYLDLRLSAEDATSAQLRAIQLTYLLQCVSRTDSPDPPTTLNCTVDLSLYHGLAPPASSSCSDLDLVLCPKCGSRLPAVRSPSPVRSEVLRHLTHCYSIACSSSSCAKCSEAGHCTPMCPLLTATVHSVAALIHDVLDGRH